MVEVATTAGATDAIAEAQTMLTAGTQAVDLITSLCNNVTMMIAAIEGFLFPALFAAAMTLVVWFDTFGACCGMGCCGTPKARKVAPSS